MFTPTVVSAAQLYTTTFTSRGEDNVTLEWSGEDGDGDGVVRSGELTGTLRVTHNEHRWSLDVTSID